MAENVQLWFHSAKSGRKDDTEELLKSDKKYLNTKDALGNSALIYAAASNHSDVVKFLIENKADLNIKNNAGDTAAHKAAWKGNEAVCLLLRDAGADLNIKNNEGMTPEQVASNSAAKSAVTPVAQKLWEDVGAGASDEESGSD